MSKDSLMTRFVKRLPDFFALMRVNKPIGTFLLLWPTLTALWIASNGQPSGQLLFIFIAGVTLMRAAGCVINDFADRDWDGLVSRTKDRPMAQNNIQSYEALLLFGLLVLTAFGLVYMTNLLTIKLSIAALALATLYPFTKRFTYFPQVFLGAAFSFGIPMAFSATQNTIPWHAWLLFVFNWVWTVAYDTQYALVDREDDEKANIKSIAIFFGPYDRLAITSLQIICLIPLALLASRLQMPFPFVVGMAVIASLFFYQNRLILYREPENCFRAFLNNAWVGAALYAGTVSSYWLINHG